MQQKHQTQIDGGKHMKKWISRGYMPVFILLVVLLVLGQAVSYLAAAATWRAYIDVLPKYLSQIAFWGPVVALIAAVFVWAMLKLLGFNSLAEIRNESVEQNNPAPAVIFAGTLIASILFLMLVLR
jgi:hypothetical protein